MSYKQKLLFKTGPFKRKIGEIVEIFYEEGGIILNGKIKIINYSKNPFPCGNYGYEIEMNEYIIFRGLKPSKLEVSEAIVDGPFFEES